MMIKPTNKKRFLAVFSLLPILALACRAALPQGQADTSNQPVPARQVEAPVQPAEPILLPEAVTDEQGVLISLYQRANPAVVYIAIYGESNGQVVPVGQGSGFVYDNEGYIITNAHVVENAEQVEVGFSDGLVSSADIVGKDLNSDLAVVKVEKMPSGISPLPLGDINSVLVGETVIAIGNPFGLEGTLTRGVVSAIGRTIPALTPFSIPQAIQTDAAINPGNSGGPLLNLQGQVIGVNAQIETNGVSQSNSGVGFAIPVSIVSRVVPELISKGEYTWGWLGVRGGSLSAAEVKAMNLPVDRGAYLSEIVSGGPAEKAGLKGSSGQKTVDGRTVEVGGDVIVAIDGQPVNTFDDLLLYIAMNTSPGQEVTLTVVRGGETQEVKLTLEPRPENLEEPSTLPFNRP